MPAKRLAAKSPKSAASSAVKTVRAAKTSKARVLKPEFTPEEVATFEQQLARHQRSEKAWQRLTALPDGDDRWSEVEESLVYRGQREQHAERRWKYFAK